MKRTAQLGLLFAAGALIAAVCVYRVWTNQPYDYDASLKAATIHAPAPLFEGVDENNQMFRLAAYAGRHRIVVVFFDGAVGADRDAAMMALKEHAEELAKQDVKVVALSQTIPQENRAALERLGGWPGPLISDIDGSIHQKWGRLTTEGAPQPGVFLIDRKGTVAFYAGAPRPYSDLDQLWKDLRS